MELTPKEIKEGNRIIADKYGKLTSEFSGRYSFEFMSKYNWNVPDMQFHKQFNWVVPAWAVSNAELNSLVNHETNSEILAKVEIERANYFWGVNHNEVLTAFKAVLEIIKLIKHLTP